MCIDFHFTLLVCENWMRPDMSIWETRGELRHFLYSKVMCWVAVDRGSVAYFHHASRLSAGIRFVEKRSLPCPNRENWYKVRDEIYEEIMQKGWCSKKQCFTQSYESAVNGYPTKGMECTLDAAVLIMPMTFFMR